MENLKLSEKIGHLKRKLKEKNLKIKQLINKAHYQNAVTVKLKELIKDLEAKNFLTEEAAAVLQV